MTSLRRQLSVFVVTNITTMFIVMVLGYMYINNVDQKRAASERKQDRQWCELIVLYDDYFKANPPQPGTQQGDLLGKQAALMHRRRETLGC